MADVITSRNIILQCFERKYYLCRIPVEYETLLIFFSLNGSFSKVDFVANFANVSICLLSSMPV